MPSPAQATEKKIQNNDSKASAQELRGHTAERTKKLNDSLINNYNQTIAYETARLEEMNKANWFSRQFDKHFIGNREVAEKALAAARAGLEKATAWNTNYEKLNVPNAKPEEKAKLVNSFNKQLLNTARASGQVAREAHDAAFHTEVAYRTAQGVEIGATIATTVLSAGTAGAAIKGAGVLARAKSGLDVVKGAQTAEEGFLAARIVAKELIAGGPTVTQAVSNLRQGVSWGQKLLGIGAGNAFGYVTSRVQLSGHEEISEDHHQQQLERVNRSELSEEDKGLKTEALALDREETRYEAENDHENRLIRNFALSLSPWSGPKLFPSFNIGSKVGGIAGKVLGGAGTVVSWIMPKTWKGVWVSYELATNLPEKTEEKSWKQWGQEWLRASASSGFGHAVQGINYLSKEVINSSKDLKLQGGVGTNNLFSNTNSMATPSGLDSKPGAITNPTTQPGPVVGTAGNGGGPQPVSGQKKSRLNLDNE